MADGPTRRAQHALVNVQMELHVSDVELLKTVYPNAFRSMLRRMVRRLADQHRIARGLEPHEDWKEPGRK